MNNLMAIICENGCELMKNKLKNLILGVTACIGVTLAGICMPAYAAGFGVDQLFYDSFDSGTSSIVNESGKIIATEDTYDVMHNTVLTISNTDGKQSGTIFSRFQQPEVWTKSKKILISYELMQSGPGTSSDKFENWFRLKGTKGNRDMMLRIQSSNKINLYYDSDGAKVNFEQDTWYAIDVAIDFDNGRYQCFVNGNMINSGSLGEYTSLQNLYFGSKMEPGSILKLMLDNFTVSDFGASKYVYTDASVAEDGSYVKIRLSESMLPDMKDCISETKIVNTLTESSVSIGTPEMCGRTILIPIEDAMTELGEYAVILPQGHKSILGKELADNIVYIQGIEKKPSLKHEILSDDYEEDEKFRPYLDRAGHDIVDWDESYGKVLKLSGTGKSKNSGIFYTVDEMQTSNNLIIQYDTYIEKEGSLFSLIAECELNKFAGNFCFNKSGKLASISSDTMADAECQYAETDQNGFKLMNCDANIWHRVMHVINRINGTVDTYIDDNKISTEIIRTDPVLRIYFRQFAYNGTDGTEDSDVMYIDNFKVGYDESVKEYVNSVRITDSTGNIYGPLTNCVRASAEAMKIKFSAPIETTDVMKYIKVYSDNHSPELLQGEYSDQNNELTIYFGEYLHMGDKYNIHITVPNSTNGNVFAEYNSSFTVSSYSELKIENITVKANGVKVTDLSEISDGAELSLSFDVKNITEEDVEVVASFLGKNDFALKNNQTSMQKVAAYTNSYFIDIMSFKAEDMTDFEVIFTDKEYKLLAEPLKIGGAEFIPDKWSLNISGVIENEGESILINVVKPGKKLSALDDTNANDIIAYKAVDSVGENGSFNINFKMRGYPSGEYTAVLTSGSNTVEMPVVYVDIEHFRDYVLLPLNDCTSISDVKNVLEAGIDDCGINSKKFVGSTFKVASKIIHSYLSAGNRFVLTDAKLEESKNILQKALVIDLVCNGSIDDMFAYGDALGLDNGLLANLYKKTYVSAEVKKNITTALRGQEIDSFDNFDEKLYELFTLKVIASAKGYDDVREVMQALSGKIGIGSSGSNDAYRAVTGKRYSSYADLKAAFDAANVSVPNSYGGGGGGGSSSTTGKSFSAPLSNGTGETKEQIPIRIFCDLDSVPWAQEAITSLAEKGIISGRTQERFYPNDYITRAEFARIVADAFAADTKPAQIKFNDVHSSDWYSNYVARCYSAELIMGVSDELFGAADTLTRQDLVVILCRAAEKTNYKFIETKRPAFKDADSISDYAKSSVEKMYSSGLINGVDSELFAPLANATRAQAAYLVYKIKDN